MFYPWMLVPIQPAVLLEGLQQARVTAINQIINKLQGTTALEEVQSKVSSASPNGSSVALDSHP
jgi:hypothetical protein